MVGDIQISAESEEAAIEEAINRLGVERDALEFEVKSESEDELLPGTKPEVELRAWIRPDYIGEKALDLVGDILDIIGIEFELETSVENRIIYLNVQAGDDSSLLIGRDGQNLSAIQYLLNRMLIKIAREAPMVLVDIEGYRKRQYVELEELVQRAVERARETGNEIELDPMMSVTRKYLHNYLRKFDDIKTFSRGDEPERYLVIISD